MPRLALLLSGLVALACAPKPALVVQPLPPCLIPNATSEAWRVRTLDSLGASLSMPVAFKPAANQRDSTGAHSWIRRSPDSLWARIRLAREARDCSSDFPACAGLGTACVDTVDGHPLAIETGFSPGDIWPHYVVQAYWMVTATEGLAISVQSAAVAGQAQGLAVLRTLRER